MNDLPISPARRTKDITYAIRDVVLVAQEVASEGRELLKLNIGDPNQFDFVTPRLIVEATHQAMLNNHNGYAPSHGIAEAVDAIRADAESKGIRSIHNAFVTTGASEAIDICLTALINEGENVLTPSPGYPLYSGILSKLCAEPNTYYLDESNGWQPDLDDIAGRINDRTRAIIIINPNNPTGAVYSRRTLQGIVDIAKRHGLVIFSDEIYDELIYNGQEHISVASLDADAPIVTFKGLSKVYMVPGFRIGWGIISGRASRLGGYIEAVDKLLRSRLCSNHPSQYAIRPALEGDQGHLGETIERLTRRRDITVEMLNAIEGISCVAPQGAFYAFARLDIEADDDAFVRELIRETGVVVVPGSGFGQVPGTKHFRVVFLPPEDILKEAYARIGRFMGAYLARRQHAT